VLGALWPLRGVLGAWCLVLCGRCGFFQSKIKNHRSNGGIWDRVYGFLNLDF
jgi:hypothetical protein